MALMKTTIVNQDGSKTVNTNNGSSVSSVTIPKVGAVTATPSSLIPSNDLTNSSSLIPSVSSSSQDNQTRYLNSLIATGDTGQKAWAQSQLANLIPNQTTWIDNNQNNYLSGLVAQGGLTGDWAKSQLASGVMPITTTPTPITTPTPVTPTPVEIPTLIPPIPKVEVPVYTPYVVQPFQQTTPNYSITSDPSKTSFIPTSKAKDRWATQQATNADNAYKAYTSQANAYSQTYKEQQDAIANQQAQLPYEKMTVAQQAAAAIDAANVKTKTDQTAYDAALNRWTTVGSVLSDADAAILSVPVGTQTNDASYRDATLAATAAAQQAKSSGGGLTAYQQYEVQQGTNKSDADSLAAMNKWVTDKVTGDSRLSSDNSNYAALYDAWKTMYVTNNYGGSANP